MILWGKVFLVSEVQGYLAHKKHDWFAFPCELSNLGLGASVAQLGAYCHREGAASLLSR